MTIHEVTNAHDKRSFLKVPKVLYSKDKNWVCPLDQDVEAVFDPAQNLYYHKGECKRWLLLDENKEAIGRVAAFYHDQFPGSLGKTTGGMGFFECPENPDAARLLFDTCKTWLQSKGINGMDGPVNFGEKDRFWGLMVNGFKNPSYLEN